MDKIEAIAKLKAARETGSPVDDEALQIAIDELIRNLPKDPNYSGKG